jgi:hypothetical protein
MSIPANGTSVVRSIVVQAPLERAFSAFVEHFDRVKPREHNMLAVDIEETVLEPRVGGRIFDRGVDGSECQWARVLAFEPPDRTRVALEHRNLDRHGPGWEAERDIVDSEGGWPLYLQRYTDVVAAS